MLKIIFYTISPFVVSFILLAIFGTSNIETMLYLSPVSFLIPYLIVSRSKKIVDAPFELRDFLIIARNVIILIGLNVLVSMIMPETPNQEVKDMLSQVPKLSMIIIAVILVPIAEELFFRKGYLTLINNNNVAYIIVNSIIFAIMHFEGTGSLANNLGILTVTCLTSVLFSWTYLKHKKLYINIVTHALINFLALMG